VYYQEGGHFPDVPRVACSPGALPPAVWYCREGAVQDSRVASRGARLAWDGLTVLRSHQAALSKALYTTIFDYS